jgi:hypothetical protein
VLKKEFLAREGQLTDGIAQALEGQANERVRGVSSVDTSFRFTTSGRKRRRSKHRQKLTNL